MKEANGRVIFEHKCECPYCEWDNDLQKVDEWWTIFGGRPEAMQNVNYEHKCEYCGEIFLIKNMHY